MARAFETLEKSVGGRDALVSALLTHTLNPDDVYLVGLLADPANSRLNLAMVCAQGGVGLGQVFALFKSAVKTRALVQATVEVAARLPEVAKGVMEDAVAGERPCGKCRGAGYVTAQPTDSQPNPTPEVCKTCQGTGTQIHEPETRIRELALELGGMIEKHPQVTINQTKQQIGVVAIGAYDKLVAGLDTVLYGDPRGEVIDGELGEEAADATGVSTAPGAGAADGAVDGGRDLRSGAPGGSDRPVAGDVTPGRDETNAGGGAAHDSPGDPPRLLRRL